jgi:quinol monooxygenase YgiN
MSRVMFTISYSIDPERREEFIRLLAELKAHFAALGRKNYMVFESRGKKNHFTEVFLTESMEEFDALEDNQDEKTQELIQRLEECVDKGGMKYSTGLEVA